MTDRHLKKSEGEEERRGIDYYMDVMMSECAHKVTFMAWTRHENLVESREERDPRRSSRFRRKLSLLMLSSKQVTSISALSILVSDGDSGNRKASVLVINSAAIFEILILLLSSDSHDCASTLGRRSFSGLCSLRAFSITNEFLGDSKLSSRIFLVLQ